MNTNPDFDLEHHRRVAARVASGRATSEEVEASQESLVEEVARLTGSIPIGRGTFLRAEGIDDLIGALEAFRGHAVLYAETGGTRTLAGTIGSYRGYYDHLRICTGSRKTRTVADMLKWLRSIKHAGFEGDGQRYTASKDKPIWLAEMDNTSDWALAGVLSEGDEVILVGQKNVGW